MLNTGYKKPVKVLTLGDISEVIDILKCHCIKVSIPEINQYSDGLKALGVLEYIKKYPDIMRDLFVDDGKRLTAGKFNVLPLYVFAKWYIVIF